MPQSYTYDELVKMGAKPGGYTFEELRGLGATESAAPSISPTLLASRKEIAKQEFEKNLPGYNTLPGRSSLFKAFAPVMDVAIGAEQAVGLDPMHPVRSLFQQIRQPAGIATPLVEAVQQPLMGQGTGKLQSMISAPVVAAKGVVEGIQEKDPAKAFRSAGSLYATARPFAGPVIGSATKAAGNVATKGSAIGNLIGEKLIQSWMPLKKSSLDFGRDPVAAVRQLPMATTRQGMLDNIDHALSHPVTEGPIPVGGAEGELLKAIDRRAQVAAESGFDDGMDVGKALRGSVAEEVSRAERTGHHETANQITATVESRIQQLQRKYGSTYLTPAEIFVEKRLLANDVDFKGTDTASVNVNKALQSMYRGLDHSFDTILPEASGINDFYSGLLEAKKLISEDLMQQKNAPIVHETFWGTLKSAIPETATKTLLNRLFSGRPQLPAAGGSALEFYQRPGTALPRDLYNARGNLEGRPPVPPPGSKPLEQTPRMPTPAEIAALGNRISGEPPVPPRGSKPLERAPRPATEAEIAALALERTKEALRKRLPIPPRGY